MTNPQIHHNVMSNLKVIFVIGGAGAGKTSQCVRLVEKYPDKLTHISIGKVLQAESDKPCSQWADMLARHLEGRLRDKEMMVALPEDALQRVEKED
jgi:adenylate kinase family enzyme